VQRLEAPRIGVLNLPSFVSIAREYLPHATIVPLGSVQEVFEFFEHKGRDLDALFLTAETGSVLSLFHPEYTVAIPHPDIITVPLAYAMPHGERELRDIVNTWITLRKQDRTIASLYDRWILGQSAASKQPRWSVIRNVLHWIE
jgi:ABC-type amino acid transport substrate-binding protein